MKYLIIDLIRRKRLLLAISALCFLSLGTYMLVTFPELAPDLLTARVAFYFSFIFIGFGLWGNPQRVWASLPVSTKDKGSAFWFCSIPLMPLLYTATQFLLYVAGLCTGSRTVMSFLQLPVVLLTLMAVNAFFILLFVGLRRTIELSHSPSETGAISLGVGTFLLLCGETLVWSVVLALIICWWSYVDLISSTFLLVTSAILVPLGGLRLLPLILRIVRGRVRLRLRHDRSELVGIGTVLHGYVCLCSLMALVFIVPIAIYPPDTPMVWAAAVFALVCLDVALIADSFRLREPFAEQWKRDFHRPTTPKWPNTFAALIPRDESDPLDSAMLLKRVREAVASAGRWVAGVPSLRVFQRRVLGPLYPWAWALAVGAITGGAACVYVWLFLPGIVRLLLRSQENGFRLMVALTLPAVAAMVLSQFAGWFGAIRVFRLLPFSSNSLAWRLFVLSLLPVLPFMAVWIPSLLFAAGWQIGLVALACGLIGASGAVVLLPLSRHAAVFLLMLASAIIIVPYVFANTERLPWPHMLGASAVLFLLGFLELRWLIGRSTAFYRPSTSHSGAQGGTR